MKMILAAVLLCFSVAAAYDVKVDLSTGTTTGTDSAITWHNALASSGTCGCTWRGVLKLTFGAPGSSKSKALINMKFTSPSGWVFNIGDSRTNNGWGGDSSTNSRDCEVQGLGSGFRIHGNDYNSPAGGMLYNKAGAIDTFLSVTIADGLVIWNNLENESSYMYDVNTLFALNGQADAQAGSANYDVYFAMNRVVGTTSRSGTGLCEAEITWV